MNALPELAGEITPENAAQVVPLAVWGNLRANTIALSADGQVLAVGTDLGATLYDSHLLRPNHPDPHAISPSPWSHCLLRG